MIVGPINRKKLTDEPISQLITTGRTSLFKVQKKKGMTIYEACLVLTDEFKIRLEIKQPI
jgi:hypothetical protein